MANQGQPTACQLVVRVARTLHSGPYPHQLPARSTLLQLQWGNAGNQWPAAKGGRSELCLCLHQNVQEWENHTIRGQHGQSLTEAACAELTSHVQQQTKDFFCKWRETSQDPGWDASSRKYYCQCSTIQETRGQCHGNTAPKSTKWPSLYCPLYRLWVQYHMPKVYDTIFRQALLQYSAIYKLKYRLYIYINKWIIYIYKQMDVAQDSFGVPHGTSSYFWPDISCCIK